MKTMIKIRDDFGNALTIGELYNGIFYITRKRSKHFFVKHEGWAIDRKVAEGIDALEFVLRDTDNDLTYRITKQKFLEFAEPIANRGHREQLVVKEVHWTVTKPKGDFDTRMEELRKAYRGGK